MFCTICGNQIQDSEMFCPKCGTPVSAPETVTLQAEQASVPVTPAQIPYQNAQPQMQMPYHNMQAQPQMPYHNMQAQPQMPYQNAGVQPPTKGGKSKILIPLLIAGVAVAAGIIAVVVNAASIGNFFHKTFSTPEKYYQYVEGKNADETAEIIASSYGSYVENAKNIFNTAYNTSISLAIGEEGKDLLELAGLAGLDMSWLNEISLSGGVTLNENSVSINMATGMNEETLLSFIMLLDIKEGEAFLQIPELTSTYIGIDIEENVGRSYDDFRDVWEEMQEMSKDTLASLPSQVEFEKLLSKYMKIALSGIEDVDKKDKTLKVEGVEQKCTALIVTIDADTMADIFDAILKEAEDDQELEQFIVDFAEAVDYDGDDVYDALIDGLDDIQSSLSRISSREEIVMTVYVNGKGEVVGREFEIDGVTISMLMPEKGKNFGYEFSIEGSGASVSLTGSGTKSGDKIDGDFRLRYDGATVMNITTEELDLKTLRRGKLNGKLEMSLGSGIRELIGSGQGLSILQKISFTLEAKTTDNSFTYRYGILYDDGDIGSITVSAGQEKSSTVKLPGSKDVIFVEDDRDLEEWFNGIDWDNVVSVLKKVNLPKSLIDLVESFGEAVKDGNADEWLEELLWDYYGYYYYLSP